MLVVFVSTLAFLALGGALHRHAGIPIAVVSGVQLALAAGLWRASLRLHDALMRRRAVLEAAQGVPRSDSAETESRLRWVTQLTNLAFGIALAAVIPLLEAIQP